MNKFLIVLVLSIALLTSSIVSSAYAGSESKIVKSIKKDAGKFKKVCEVWISTVGNKDLHKVYVKSNSDKCDTAVPEPPKNQKPFVKLDSPIKCISGLDCSLTTDEYGDNDGNITSIQWAKLSDQNVTYVVNEGNNSITFTPNENGTYKFSITVTDDDGATASDIGVVNVGEETPIPEPEPEPEPTTNETKVALAGDFGGSSVFNAIKNANTDYVVALGDLFYGSDLSQYKSTFVKQFGNNVDCVIGNHDSREDGSASIEAESIEVCGNIWFKVLPQTLVIGFNSNGDIQEQVSKVKSVNYTDYKNVVVVSHKPCDVFPNAHHPLSEAKDVKLVCDAVKQSAVGKNIILVSGHNHNMAGTEDGKAFVSGAGGRNHYVCDTDSKWTFCNNQKYGFLELGIDNNSGDISASFVDTNGQVVKQW